jgi:hypothetical protein
MNKVHGISAATAVWALALAGVLATDAMGQAPAGAGAGASAVQRGAPTTPAKPAAADAVSSLNTEDMKLWSFGDCARVYPYASSEQYKQCVKVVGSDEAKEARAFRFCQTSFEKDPAEAARCKAAYQENRRKAASDGLVTGAPAAPQTPLPPEVLQRVRNIATAGAERDRVAPLDPAVATGHPVAGGPDPVVAEFAPVARAASPASPPKEIYDPGDSTGVIIARQVPWIMTALGLLLIVALYLRYKKQQDAPRPPGTRF